MEQPWEGLEAPPHLWDTAGAGRVLCIRPMPDVSLLYGHWTVNHQTLNTVTIYTGSLPLATLPVLKECHYFRTNSSPNRSVCNKTWFHKNYC